MALFCVVDTTDRHLCRSRVLTQANGGQGEGDDLESTNTVRKQGNGIATVVTHWRHHFMVAPTSRMAPSAAADTATASLLSGVGRLARIE